MSRLSPPFWIGPSCVWSVLDPAPLLVPTFCLLSTLATSADEGNRLEKGRHGWTKLDAVDKRREASISVATNRAQAETGKRKRWARNLQKPTLLQDALQAHQVRVVQHVQQSRRNNLGCQTTKPRRQQRTETLAEARSIDGVDRHREGLKASRQPTHTVRRRADEGRTRWSPCCPSGLLSLSSAPSCRT